MQMKPRHRQLTKLLKVMQVVRGRARLLPRSSGSRIRALRPGVELFLDPGLGQDPSLPLEHWVKPLLWVREQGHKKVTPSKCTVL